MAWGIQEDYYSGQGVVMVGVRGADGKPMGLRPVGNVPDLKIAVETSTLEHKESTTGARGTDLRLTTELKCNLNFTLENFSAQNLAEALRGVFQEIAAGAVVDKAIKAYPGLITSLDHIQISAVSLEFDSVALEPYTDEDTPWDYMLNTDAGSIKFNDGAVLATDVLFIPTTAVTVGTTTSYAMDGTGLSAGGTFVIRDAAGTDAAFVNGVKQTIVSANGTAVVTSLNTTGKTITAAAGKVVADGMPVTVSYSYGRQMLVDALNAGAKELYMRFEGLNTVQENKPVIVEVFRFLTDPMKELALIGDTVQQFVLEGSALADTSRVTGSKYFRVLKTS